MNINTLNVFQLILGIVLLCKSSTYRFKVSSLYRWQLDCVTFIQPWLNFHLLYFTTHKFTIWTDHSIHLPSVSTVFTPLKQNSQFVGSWHCLKTLFKNKFYKVYSPSVSSSDNHAHYISNLLFSGRILCLDKFPFFFLLIRNMAAGMSTHGSTAFRHIVYNTNKVHFQLPWLLACWLFHKVMQGSFCGNIMLVKWDYYSAGIVPISQFYCTNHLCVGRDALRCDLGLIWLMTKFNK